MRTVQLPAFMRDGEAQPWHLDGLGAAGPHPRFKNRLMLFGQFVGDWDIISVKSPNPSGVAFKAGGEVHFAWILGGRAIQDVWMTYDDELKKAVPVGTTIRVYNPGSGAWKSTWISVIRHTVQTFIARQFREDVILEGITEAAKPERWIFSDISPDSFRWHSEESSDDGESWTLTEEMIMRRRRPSRQLKD